VNDLRVLVVASDQLARAGLAALLAQQPGTLTVDQAGADEDFQIVLETSRPDVVLWDLGWNPAGDLERIAQLPENTPPVLALIPDESHAAETWAAGVGGLLLRDVDAALLLTALAARAQGLVVLDPALSGAAPTARPLPTGPLPELTQRELQALRLLAEGLPNKTIATRMDISEHTVKFHVNSILGKLGAQSRTEAVTRATRLGLILL
jgi:DNA-binding NarL/FixJ family response regulator